MAFVFCVLTLLIGAVTMYFTIDTQALLKKKAG
jgi:Na+-transporting methylmalonyl-CoA/oxaloacetate decarboxylase gamma subunit